MPFLKNLRGSTHYLNGSSTSYSLTEDQQVHSNKRDDQIDFLRELILPSVSVNLVIGATAGGILGFFVPLIRGPQATEADYLTESNYCVVLGACLGSGAAIVTGLIVIGEEMLLVKY